MITTFYNTLPKSIALVLLRSMANSINASAIAYARVHLRRQEFDRSQGVIEDDHIPTIDDYNDLMAAEAEGDENMEARERMGFDRGMPPLIVCEALMRIRAHFAGKLAEHKRDNRDQVNSIVETYDFLIERASTAKSDMAKLRTLADLADIDVSLLQHIETSDNASQAADLRKYKGQILDLLSKWQECEYFDESVIEELFNNLPAHIQYKMGARVMKGYKDQLNRCVLALIKNQNVLEQAGNIKLLKALIEELKLWAQSFSARKRNELDAYVERGNTLPDIIDEAIA